MMTLGTLVVKSLKFLALGNLSQVVEILLLQL